MERIRVCGGRSLGGRVRISGAKNAALPIIAASLLADKEVNLRDVPSLDDVYTMCQVISGIGAQVKDIKGDVRILTRGILNSEVPYEPSRRMRASILVMGPLLARLGQVRMAFPGGCAIGSRPIDLHLKGFEAMGASISLEHGFVEARVKGELQGAKIYLDFPSVGATENIMMAACLARGSTVIENAAQEPEIVDLANFLVRLGARITGAGTSSIKVEGVRSLGSTSYTIIPDRIEAGTYMIASAITGGDIYLENVVPEHCQSVILKLRETGTIVEEKAGGLRVVGVRRPKACHVKTLPYPGFPTDMQAQMTAFLSICEGTSLVTETVFENRFMYVSELKRMGASLRVEGGTAFIEGVPRLTGTFVRATDLRAGAALVLAGLAASDETVIEDVYHIDRGYESMEKKLRALGADIRREGMDESRVMGAL